jgi:hypothetical protein
LGHVIGTVVVGGVDPESLLMQRPAQRRQTRRRHCRPRLVRRQWMGVHDPGGTRRKIYGSERWPIGS